MSNGSNQAAGVCRDGFGHRIDPNPTMLMAFSFWAETFGKDKTHQKEEGPVFYSREKDKSSQGDPSKS